MIETKRTPLTEILAVAAVVEVGTGFALIIAPGVVVALLLGAEVSGVGTALGRCFGIALVALGVACSPRGQTTDRASAIVRAMLIYNLSIAIYLAYLGAVGPLGGVLLWPAVALHAVVALLLIRTWRAEQPTRT